MFSEAGGSRQVVSGINMDVDGFVSGINMNIDGSVAFGDSPGICSYSDG